MRIFFRSIFFKQYQSLVSFLDFKICKPINTGNTNHTFSMVTCCSDIFIFAIEMSGSTFKTIA